MNIREKIAQELHKPARKKFERRHVTLKGLHDTLQGDLVEMIPYARENKGYKYILTVINIFSKFGFAVPFKSKRGEEVARALETDFTETSR